MQTTRTLFGASRIPLTPKRGNKDFYKGTGQSYVPSGGHRTGPPGKHVVKGSAKYRLLDSRVRYFVGPGQEALNRFDTLKPYVATEQRISPPPTNSEDESKARPTKIPTFSPILKPHPSNPLQKLTITDHKAFSKRYRALNVDERQALIMDARRKWWDGLVGKFGVEASEAANSSTEGEERATRVIEERAEAQSV